MNQELDEYMEMLNKRRVSVVLCPADFNALSDRWRECQRPSGTDELSKMVVDETMWRSVLRDMFGDETVDEWFNNSPCIIDIYRSREDGQPVTDGSGE